MTAPELQDWLNKDESAGSGRYATIQPPHFPIRSLSNPSTLSIPPTHSPLRSKSDGETVGHESGRKIIAILEKNPKKDAQKYEDDDIEHMRRVVAYCKRHLAQEEKAKRDTESRSYRSLKNWGHDALKT